MSDPGPEELRAALHRAADWAADFLASNDSRPVSLSVAPGAIAAALPDRAPAEGEPLDALLDDVDRVLVPGLTHWNHPGFMAYFGITGSPPGILGELVAATLNVNSMLWRTSPAATELEQVALRWMLDLIGLPSDWFGEITDGASASTFFALAAAREAAGVDVRGAGLAGRRDVPPLRVYASVEAHSSVEKACIALGLGQKGLRKIPTDNAFRLRPGDLARAVAQDLESGVKPIAAVATVGTTSSTSIDPVPATADICAEHDMWLHVDAAYGGAAALVPSLRHVLDGCERADSLVVNPHKWVLTPLDCSLLYTARPDDLRAAFSLVPAYLTSERDDVVNFMDYGLTLGRRFRALKLWMVLRAYGSSGLERIIRRHVDLAQQLAAWVEAEPDWELLAPVPFSTVNLRHHPAGMDDEDALREHNAQLIEAVNASGEVFISHTELASHYAIRIAIGNVATEHRHVRRAWELLLEAAIT
ncbi:MAG TPA: pyridoxal-dependent decarboxylase [Gaiellales bacterium]|nr:pyridoxal-dependent decarboxylase [Gaiellales bacterium]